MRDAAEAAYDRTPACAFTTFVGYEWTASGAAGANLHRNVIFRNANVPRLPASSVESASAYDLWMRLQRECIQGTKGCDALTIPHNSNLSGPGLMFVSAKLPLGGGEAPDVDAAEAKLRQAVELGSDVGETWVALVQFLARRDAAEAKKVIAEAQKKLPAEQAPLALAQCYEVIGELDTAETQYRAAVQAKPNDMAVQRSAASFWLRLGKADVANRALRDIMAKGSGTDKDWARRELALLVASRGDYTKFGEALALVGMKLDPAGKIVEEASTLQGDELFEEQRTRARVLAAQPFREPRRKAIVILEDLAKRQTLTPEDQFLLAQFYDAAGDWERARRQFVGITSPARSPVHLAQFCGILLRQRELKEAENAIGRLEQLEKDRSVPAGAFGSIELRAQWFEASKQGDRAVKLLADHVGTKGTRPEKVFLVVGCLTRQERYAEALKVCEQARLLCPAELVAAASVGVLRAQKASAEGCESVDAWLGAQIEKDPKAAGLVMQRADLKDLCGKYDEAEALYRRVLELDGGNVMARNNLAWLLASRKPGQAGKALEIINDAIALAGPRSELLDTRAAVHIAMNRGDLALRDLEAAGADGPPPVWHFRMAQAQNLANRAKEARSSLTRATSAGLKPELLHPIERVAFLKLQRELENK